MLLTVVLVMFTVWVGMTIFCHAKPDGFYKDYSFIITMVVLIAESYRLILTTGNCT